MNSEKWHPTVMFGFVEERLHQMWINELGGVKWDPVPMIELGRQKPRPTTIAGFVPQESENE